MKNNFKKYLFLIETHTHLIKIINSLIKIKYVFFFSSYNRVRRNIISFTQFNYFPYIFLLPRLLILIFSLLVLRFESFIIHCPFSFPFEFCVRSGGVGWWVKVCLGVSKKIRNKRERESGVAVSFHAALTHPMSLCGKGLGPPTRRPYPLSY